MSCGKTKPEDDARSSIARSIFVATAMIAVAFGAFAFGASAALERSFVVMLALRSSAAIEDYFAAGVFAPPQLLTDTPANAAPGEVAAAAGATVGWRAITSFDAGGKAYVVKLFAADGTLAHQWRFADGSFKLNPLKPQFVAPHGLVVLRDGRVILNSDLARMAAAYDACGNPLWRRDDTIHHQLTLDENGDVWAWRGGSSPYTQDQEIIRFSADTGKTIETISLRADIIAPHPASRMVFGLPEGFAAARAGLWDDPDADIFHPNDVEPLPAAIADKFPQFNTGDLLVSFRNMDLIAVVDRKTHEINWSARGPWRRQHDPDFMATGEISVYNNNVTGADRTVFENRSSIIAIDPKTGKSRFVLRGGPKDFFSSEMGAHSWAAADIVQIVVPYEGRVMEINLADGDAMFEFNNRITDKLSANVAMATWLPADYFTVDPSAFACPPAGP